MNTLTVSSPAKLNLHLRVTRKRPDGYHELVTLFHRISLKDTITLKKIPRGIVLTCDYPGLPTDERNIVVRAYGLLQARFPRLGGVRVRLQKKIPVGAGLGGGSSNAAFFLLGMNRLYRLGLSRKALVAMGKKLGADVPFFLYETNQALAVGRGDRIYPRPARCRQGFLLLLSEKSLSTKDVFRSRHLKPGAVSLTKATGEVRMLCHFSGLQKYQEIAALIRNDLEPPAFSLRPSISKQIQKLTRAGYPLVRMSGSGPTVFIMFSHEQEIKRHRTLVRQLFPAVRLEKVFTF
ncbi:MAG TPA: 4-(cytidine 5'-diphospho)-2-C-methyl-D-erythritol kinase [Verrucomicrobiae bacterium]|jgi:4-diphosphocytidyl-2-C-methyl-D-erythritol kinase|nr:4-(cytidine 5'-diphospho)-2-C-methyl-D-erythritol kinase [Verrucomicrobiae bacterium]